MTITYEVKDLIWVLLRKWYLILLVAVCCSLAVTPISRASYQQALENYNRKTDINYLIAEESKKVEAESTNEQVDMSKEGGSINTISGQAYYTLDMISSPEALIWPILKDQTVQVESNTLTQIASANLLKNLMELSTSDNLLVPLYNNLMQKYTVSEYAQFKNSISCSSLTGTNMICLHLVNITPDVFDSFIGEYPTQLTGLLKDIIGVDVSIKLKNAVQDEIPLATIIADDEQKQINEQAEKTLKFNKSILVRPTLETNQIKYIGSAGLFGALLACFFILAWDFTKKSIAIKKMCK